MILVDWKHECEGTDNYTYEVWYYKYDKEWIFTVSGSCHNIDIIINYCPFCGKKLEKVEDEEKK